MQGHPVFVGFKKKKGTGNGSARLAETRKHETQELLELDFISIGMLDIKQGWTPTSFHSDNPSSC